MLNMTWWDVAEMIDSPKGNLDNIAHGLEIVAGSEMPVEVAAEAGRLLVEVDRLRDQLKRLTRAVGDNADTVMRPV